MRSIETSALRTITRSLAALNHHEITNWNRALSECYCICTNSYGQGAWKIVQSVLFQEFEAAKTLWDTSISSNVSNIENILGKGSEVWAILERIEELTKVATKSDAIRFEVISFQDKLSLAGPEVTKLRQLFVDVQVKVNKASEGTEKPLSAFNYFIKDRGNQAHAISVQWDMEQPYLENHLLPIITRLSKSIAQICALLKELIAYTDDLVNHLKHCNSLVPDLLELAYFSDPSYSVSEWIREFPKDTILEAAARLTEMRTTITKPDLAFVGRADTDKWPVNRVHWYDDGHRYFRKHSSFHPHYTEGEQWVKGTVKGGSGENDFPWYWVRVSCNPKTVTRQAVSLPQTWSEPPHVLVGFRTIDCGTKDSLRASCYAENIDNQGFDIVMDYWDETTDMKQLEVFYMAIPRTDRDIQSSSTAVRATSDWHHSGANEERSCRQEIVFDREYSKKPTVLVWLSSIDSSKETTHRFEVLAEDVTTRGFTMRFRTWLGSKFFGYAASWVAFSADRANIEHHTFRPGGGPRWCHFYGLTKLDMINNKPTKIWMKLNDVNTPFVKTWDDSILFDAEYVGIRMEGHDILP
uniref:H-type lectin domain-containing protein n=1 Tax=Bionectria ochroleuca TaxID=29856 RepID=A0A0B7JME5_BIOOC